MYQQFEDLETQVIAISQEDTDLDKAAQMAERVEAPFDILFDLDRKHSGEFDRTTAYLIDKRGIVREVFPMIIHARPSWEIILREVERMLAADAK